MSRHAVATVGLLALLLAGCGADTPAVDAAADTAPDGDTAATSPADDETRANDDTSTGAPEGSSSAERPDALPADVPLPGPLLEVDVPDNQGASLRFDAMVGSTDVAALAADLAAQLEAAGWTVMLEEAENLAQLVAEDGDRRYEVRMGLAASGDQVLAEFLYDSGT